MNDKNLEQLARNAFFKRNTTLTTEAQMLQMFIAGFKAMTEFNLNSYILIKLKPRGLKHWEDGYAKLNSKMPPTYQYPFEQHLKKHEVEDGWYKMQAHMFLEYFGGINAPLIEEMIEMNIRLEKAL